jgi:hypothetical protein
VAANAAALASAAASQQQPRQEEVATTSAQSSSTVGRSHARPPLHLPLSAGALLGHSVQAAQSAAAPPPGAHPQHLQQLQPLLATMQDRSLSGDSDQSLLFLPDSGLPVPRASELSRAAPSLRAGPKLPAMPAPLSTPATCWLAWQELAAAADAATAALCGPGRTWQLALPVQPCLPPVLGAPPLPAVAPPLAARPQAHRLPAQPAAGSTGGFFGSFLDPSWLKALGPWTGLSAFQPRPLLAPPPLPPQLAQCAPRLSIQW